jgi:hypothetical protein
MTHPCWLVGSSVLLLLLAGRQRCAAVNRVCLCQTTAAATSATMSVMCTKIDVVVILRLTSPLHIHAVAHIDLTLSPDPHPTPLPACQVLGHQQQAAVHPGPPPAA